MAKQQLNSLDRFRKQAGRLVLEEYSHCEVPAGCGGVVLRWRNPHAAVPFNAHLYAPVQRALFLDGATPATSRIDLAPGQHVLAIAIENVDITGGFLMFAAKHDPKELQP